MSLYTKARKHIDMSRVKELREEKIERKIIADEIREQIREELRNINSPEFSNWRYDIDEGMTTSDVFSTTLPAQGDVSLADITSPTLPGSSPGGSQNGNTYIAGPPSGGGSGDEVNGGFVINVNSYEYDTIVFDLTAGNINKFDIFVGNKIYDLSISSGRKVVTLNKSDMKKSIDVIFSFYNYSGADYGTNTISNLSFQRRTPVNVVVSLDSPEATAFIRTDPVMKGLSAEDRKKKLLDMLDAGDEYLLKYLGITGSSARPSDITMPNSWEDAAGGGDTEVAMNDDLYNWVNKTYGLPAAEWKQKNPTKPDNSNPFLPKGSYVPKADAGGDTQIAAMWQGADGKPYSRPNIPANDSRDWPSVFTTPPDPGRKSPVPIKKVKDNKKKPVFAHYEPEGEVLSEKKRLKSPKDITSKIPGYYDGKPAPLGFPMSPPPKTVNGFHPDLVDGKKIANRFNRLDPQSAKAMPPTGNPHIDKKVRAAAKKPK
jgi:hypothetical protein